jgi:hypothetical protein
LQRGDPVRLFIFESEANTGLGLRAFARDAAGRKLPDQFGPWRQIGASGPRARLGSTRGYVDVGAGRPGGPGISDVAGGCAMTEGERAILDAIDGCDRVVAYCDEALDRFRGKKAQGQLTLRTVPDPPPADTRAVLATLRRRLAATNEREELVRRLEVLRGASCQTA